MRILHINTFDHAGGAARAVYWLHSGLKSAGVDSQMLVQHKSTSESAIKSKTGRIESLVKELRWIIDGFPLLFYPQRTVTHWSSGWFPNHLSRLVKDLNPDLIHLHWVCRGHLTINEIGKLCSLGRPVVWTLHDSWAFTGGCHVPGDCLRYKDRCGACPQLNSTANKDLSRRILSRKIKKWKRSAITVVTPSKWLAGCAGRSALFSQSRIKTIANGIDTERFAPIDQQQARAILQLPESSRTKILCGGINVHNDPNKGFHLLVESLTSLAESSWKEKIELIVFGESEPSDSLALPVDAHYLGVLHDDETLRLAYSAADLFVMPSMQENLPNSIIESLACHTPVAAFAAGGIPELIRHGENGYLVSPFDTEELAACIIQGIEEKPSAFLPARFSQTQSVAEFTSLYQHLISSHDRFG